MTNLGLGLLILTILHIYFGVFLTQSIYKKYEKPSKAKSYFAVIHKGTPIVLLNNRIFKTLQKQRRIIMSCVNPYKNKIENVIHSFLDTFVANNSNSMALTYYQMECMQFGICLFSPKALK